MRQEEEVITISDSDENSVIDIDSDCIILLHLYSSISTILKEFNSIIGDMNLLPTFTQSNIQWRNNVGDAEIMPKDWSVSNSLKIYIRNIYI